jgi:thioredoxin-related protein
MSDEELLTILSRFYHFLMREYISSYGVFHIPYGHMTQFPAICDYILQGQAQQVKTHKKFKKICRYP